LGFLGSAAMAQDAAASRAANSPTPSSEPAPGDVAVIESARATVRETAVWLARGVDSWFGDRPFSRGGEVRDGRLSLTFLKRQGESIDADLRFNARFRLPNAERWGYLFIGRDNPRDVVTDRPGALTARDRQLESASAERSFFAGLGRNINDAVDLRVGFRGGLNLYAQARYRQAWQLQPQTRAEFRQTLFWASDERFGTTTALSLDHAFSPVLVARWLAAATISQDRRRIEWETTPGLHRSFGRDRLLSFELPASGREGAGVTDYGLQLRWEQPVYKEWLLGQVVVGHFWPRPQDSSPRTGVWALGVGAQLRF
jgi:hypothetical protein